MQTTYWKHISGHISNLAFDFDYINEAVSDQGPILVQKGVIFQALKKEFLMTKMCFKYQAEILQEN